MLLNSTDDAIAKELYLVTVAAAPADQCPPAVSDVEQHHGSAHHFEVLDKGLAECREKGAKVHCVLEPQRNLGEKKSSDSRVLSLSFVLPTLLTNLIHRVPE